jgi:hypothetical protein
MFARLIGPDMIGTAAAGGKLAFHDSEWEVGLPSCGSSLEFVPIPGRQEGCQLSNIVVSYPRTVISLCRPFDFYHLMDGPGSSVPLHHGAIFNWAVSPDNLPKVENAGRLFLVAQS